MKELQFTEGRGTGIPKIYDALEDNGSPPPIIETDETHACFLFQILIHPEMKPQPIRPEVYDEVHDGVYDAHSDELSETESRILDLCNNTPQPMSEILSEFGYSRVTRNISTSINRLRDRQLLVYTIPEKPRSKNQKYQITVKIGVRSDPKNSTRTQDQWIKSHVFLTGVDKWR